MSDAIEEPDSPGPHEVIGVAIEAALDQVRTTLPGVITAYNSTTQRASVKPLIQHAHIEEDGTRIVQTLGEVHDVPVCFLGPVRGAITWPVAVGDRCLLWFSSHSLEQFKARGGDKETDPQDDRRHDLNDAMAMVTEFKAIPNTPDDAIVLTGKTLIGGYQADADANRIAIESTLTKFMTVLSGVTDTAGACAALHTALVGAGWPASWTARDGKAK